MNIPLILYDKNDKANAPDIYQIVENYFTKKRVRSINIPRFEVGDHEVGAGDINAPLDDGEILAIERKTPSDFLRSIRDGSIWEQIEVMFRHAKYVSIVITGYIQLEKGTIEIDGKGTDWEGKPILWKSASIDNLFTVIQWSGCALKFCSPEFYPMEIERLYQVANKPSERSQLRHRRIVTFPPLDERVQWLAPLAGGLERAKNLLLFAENGYISPDEDTSEYEYSSLAKALECASTMSRVDKELRPAEWGAKTILNARAKLGLNGNEYIKVERDE